MVLTVQVCKGKLLSRSRGGAASAMLTATHACVLHSKIFIFTATPAALASIR
jgi:hypothetical protein